MINIKKKLISIILFLVLTVSSFAALEVEHNLASEYP
jgi:hypothetical protein